MSQSVNPYLRIIEQLDNLVKSRFIEMFGNPLNQTSEYAYAPIKSFSKCVAGATPSTLVDEYWDDGTIPWLSSGEVNQGRIYSTEKKITQKGYENCSTHIVPAHTVLIALAGQGKTRGTVAVTEIELCTNQSICSIVTDNTIEADYLYQALRLQYDRIRSMSNGDGGRGGLNLDIVGKITVPKPPIELQKQFSDFVKQIDKSKLIAQKAAEKYDQIVKSRFVEMIKNADYFRLDQLIKPYKAKKCGNSAMPVLSITRHNGLVLQSDRFKKEIASKDKSDYKVVPRNKLVVAFPIDEGLLCAQTVVDEGIVSPAYDIYSINEELISPIVLEQYLRSDVAIQYYLSKLRGTTLRRRTLPKEDFYCMQIPLPSQCDQNSFISFLNKVNRLL